MIINRDNNRGNNNNQVIGHKKAFSIQERRPNI